MSIDQADVTDHATAAVHGHQRRGSGRRMRSPTPLYLAAPALIVVTIFYVTPIVASFVLAFTNWSTYSSDISFIGLGNIQDLLVDTRLRAGLIATFKFAIFFTIVANIVSLALALALEKTTRLNGVFRTLLFIPVLISPLAAGYLFRGILDPAGPISQILTALLGRDVSIAWLGSVDYTIFVVALIQVWKSIGIFMLIYIAGLNTIPETLVQAGQLDGANRWQVFRYVKFPMLAPAFTFNLTLSVIGALQTFELVVGTTQGGPGNATAVLNYLVWQTYSSGTYGYAATLNLALFVLIFLLCIPMVIMLRRREVQA